MSEMLNALSRASDIWRKFIPARNGNVAFIVAMVALPVTMLTGAVLDYGMANKARAEISSTLDAAVLAALQKHSLDESVDYEQVINDFVTSNLTDAGKNPLVEQVAVSGINLSNDGELSATITGKVKTDFLSIVGKTYFNISSMSAAKVGGGWVEIAMVLDNTGSMAGDKIDTLKSAASDLVNAIMIKPDDEKVKMALVPFADYVNIGVDNRNEAGLDVPADYEYTPSGQNCWNTYPDSTQQCTAIKEWTTCYNDGVPYDCEQTTGWDCTGDKGDPVEVCQDKPTKNFKFYGCMGSRAEAGGTVELSPVDGVPGMMRTWNGCGHVAPMTRLTSKRADILVGLNQMKTQGETYVPAGLAWGWRSVSSSVPFAEASEDGNDKVKKVIVLMTDGQNTRSANVRYGDPVMNNTGTVYEHQWGDTAAANAKTAKLCSDIKANDVMLYTIAFDVPEGSEVETLMKNCAGNGGQFYRAEDNVQLTDAFRRVGLALLNLRLSQ